MRPSVPKPHPGSSTLPASSPPPAWLLPPQAQGRSLLHPPAQLWGQEGCRGIYRTWSRKTLRMEPKNARAAGHVWAGHGDARRGGGDGSNEPVNHYSSVTLQTSFFFS